MDPQARKVLVIGGGFSGMAASIALRQQGIAVDLVEIDEWRCPAAPASASAVRRFARFRISGLLDDFLQHGFAA